MSETWDVAIIGSGPAGLTAAIYTARAALKTLVIAGAKWGGQLMLTGAVENFPGFPNGIQGPELMEKMRQQAEKFGAKIVLSDLTKLDKLVQLDQFDLATKTDRFQSRAVIVATGASPQWLGLPDEQRLIGKGVSSCAPCDAFFFKDKKVAVVGGGDAAMEEALVLTKFAREVVIIHRRDSFRASKIMQDRVLSNPKVKVMFNTEVVDILGQERVEGLALMSVDSIRYPLTANRLSVDGLFVAIGHSPNSQIFQGLIDFDEKGYLLPARTQNLEPNPFPSMSRTPGIFLAGDVHDSHYKQAATAAGFGCMAALDAEKWLENSN